MPPNIYNYLLKKNINATFRIYSKSCLEIFLLFFPNGLIVFTFFFSVLVVVAVRNDLQHAI